MNILKSLIVAILIVPLTSAGCVTDPVTGQQSTSKTAVYGLGSATVCSIAGVLTHDGKGARNSALAYGAIGAGVGDYMDYQAKRLYKSLASIDVKVKQRDSRIKLVMPENVTSTTNSTTLSANARSALTATSETLAQYPDTMLTINDHASGTGSDAISDLLSHNRAQSIASFL